MKSLLTSLGMRHISKYIKPFGVTGHKLILRKNRRSRKTTKNFLNKSENDNTNLASCCYGNNRPLSWYSCSAKF